MKTPKLDKLFEVARARLAPPPPPDFAADVLRAVRREPTARWLEAASVFDSLNRWFPRVALTATALMILCVAADYGMTAAGLPELDDGVLQASSLFLFNVGNL